MGPAANIRHGAPWQCIRGVWGGGQATSVLTSASGSDPQAPPTGEEPMTCDAPPAAACPRCSLVPGARHTPSVQSQCQALWSPLHSSSVRLVVLLPCCGRCCPYEYADPLQCLAQTTATGCGRPADMRASSSPIHMHPYPWPVPLLQPLSVPVP